ncbi:uncharacterized protein BP5553_06255 [Venustampulla echinocandica]|uniref:SCP domain-containing protein n=1 Tax=Venustampulla echinocandica TaxID=2656787 RepID=A0A370TMY6_9HELO|nr:uncharacterized protein BP5553_06255 [Venustampulla echinocandica]RDL36903.1 hypothetical protein BP5553_06255 [Venustampulla echinocandica]
MKPYHLLTILVYANWAEAVSTVIVIVGTVTITSSGAAPTANSTSYTNKAVFEKDILAAHNFYRAEHNATTLKWNDTSAKYASKWSARCEFEHSHGPTGENLVAGASNATTSVDVWGSERKSYNWGKPGFSEETGHFTQLVWTNTTSVGCGRTSCQGKGGTDGWYVVCEYWPPGNVVGDGNRYFKENVAKIIKGKLGDTVEGGVGSNGAGWDERRNIWSVLVVAAGVGMGVVL